MRKVMLAFSVIALAVGLNGTAQAKIQMPEQISSGVTVVELSQRQAVHWVSVEQIEKSLQNQPLMTVGFDIDDPGKNNKISWMRDHKLKIYYGDANADIAAARELNIRGIRILRASNSSYQPLPKAGKFGEEVVINSEY
ncbi:acid phosphatase/phosphotransferase [Xenorhabdus cabanillasii]|uniref:Class B acid phosphatase n=1 Tax=Xenorhabdus cabanillasii JM26 TaxID=1427517 RepID=W1JBL4_9GAMM